MRFSDLFRLSLSNLLRRKMRTFLTVLGVVIGTASIVVMVSLGLGMSRSMLQSYQSYSSLTNINVYAGGDVVGEEATVTYAARSGRETANYITQMLQKNNTSVI